MPFLILRVTVLLSTPSKVAATDAVINVALMLCDRWLQLFRVINNDAVFHPKRNGNAVGLTDSRNAIST